MPATASVFLNVNDIERSLSFYKALGFRVTSSTKRKDGVLAYADLDLDGAELGIGNILTNDDPEFRAWVATPLGAGVVVYVTLRGGVDKLFVKARRAGATIELEPTDRPYGRVFTINDPDGYVLTFLQEPRRATPRKRSNAKRPAAKKAPAKGSKARAKKAVRR